MTHVIDPPLAEAARSRSRWTRADSSGGCNSRARSSRRLELFAQLVAAQTGVPENAVQRAALEFAVQRHDQGYDAILVPETDMAAALADGFPAELLKNTDELRAGDDRQTLAHAGTASLRRTMPEPTGRPSSRRPST
jgi:hypothetical protein